MKDAGEPYSRIYVKKDLHPAVHREWKTLLEAKKTEGRNLRISTVTSPWILNDVSYYVMES